MREPLISTLPWLWFFMTGKKSFGKYVFISGPPRSGTTLVKTLLICHSEFAGTDYESSGIFKLRDFYKYECRDLPKSDIDRMLRDCRDVVRFYEHFSQSILRRYGKSIFVDKVWPGLLRLYFVTRHFPDARWLWLCRDPRDCLCSARKHPHIPQARTAASYYRYWLRCMKLCETLLPRDRRLLVRYESLVSRPEEELTNIMQYLGYERDPRQLDAGYRAVATSMARRDVHSRLAKPITAGTVRRYRYELSPDEVGLCERIMKSQLQRWGYSD